MAFYVLALGLCVVAAVTDLRWGSIPNGLTLPALGLAPLVHGVSAMSQGGSLSRGAAATGLSLVGMAVCGLFPFWLWTRDFMGGGDVKLLGAVGALLLPEGGIEAELCAFLVAGALAVAYVIARGQLGRVFVNMAKLASAPPAGSEAPATVGGFRLGPSFAIAVFIEFVIHWGKQ